MGNDYANYVPWADFVRVYGSLGMPILAPTAAPNRASRGHPADRQGTRDRRFSEGVELAGAPAQAAKGRADH